ncbi:raffinose/stachyose/melibiose transport system substrate-binding protein [Pararhizobium capsulatum DSM 1112]|uniref:Raffinose/stachyose/melibiose transport system substrate-binding protein n=1 Tax=Pararhizobium capsulatum DSM 1112 TaxID=1121113 RepID=A0ABU0BZW6_9HYPH|nr:extracellular solute-binding protein [Pararhizobium capsulatum]MDQ0323806.1 raffinose/stachyose/melibiose transport system substrate-binding protein [Pararhizobium capsulatum DSM 1112]
MKTNTFLSTTSLGSLVVAAFAIGGVSPAYAADSVVADPNAAVEYSGTISVLTKFGLQQLSPFFVKAAQEYEKLHPGVKVELIQESDDSVKGKTKALVASNSLPDVYFTWTGSWGENFVRGNRAVDLTPVIGPDTEWGKTLAPAAVSAFQYNGKLYGIPLYLDAKFMGYNKSLFEKAGVSEPKSFEELLSACATLRKSDVTPVSFGNKEGWPGVHYAGQLLAYNVPQATLEKDFVPATAEFADPGYVVSLTQFKNLIDQCSDGAGTNGSSYASAIQQFGSGKAAMYYQEIIEFDQSTVEGALKREDFAFFKLPAPKDAKGDVKSIEGAPEGYMISAASKNIPLAIDFMRFATSPENGRVLSAPPYGQPSATVGGYSAETMNPAVVDGLKVIADSSYLMPWLDTANPPRVAAAWLSGLQALVGGTMTPEEVMQRVKEAAASSK